MEKIVIIGGGAAGMAAGIFLGEQGHKVHQSPDQPHQCGRGADALRKARDQRRHQHGTRHVEKTGSQHKDDVFGINFLSHR